MTTNDTPRNRTLANRMNRVRVFMIHLRDDAVFFEQTQRSNAGYVYVKERQVAANRIYAKINASR
jgi:hypothetical protein